MEIKKMNRWIQTIASLGCTTAAFGWGGSYAPTPTPSSLPPSDFPLNPDQQWFTKETYLIMKPYEDDNDYASRLKTKGSLASDLSMDMKLQKPDFDWASGLRLGLGRYLANHDKWDISLFTTYFYAQEESSSSPQRSHGTLLTPLWNPTFDGGTTKGHVLWRLNFFNWDFSIGREYTLLKTIGIHPFIGLRTALIFKDYKASYSDTFADRSIKDHFKASDHFWGVGPRIGSDFQFYFKNHWAFLGSLSGALFFGHYAIKEHTSTHISNSEDLTIKRYRTVDKHYSVRANLDTSLGLGWETWFNEHKVRFAPSVLVEASCWFNTNRFFLAKPNGTTAASLTTLPTFINSRREGNLILMGVSLNLQTDF
jgi:hypothetical protein